MWRCGYVWRLPLFLQPGPQPVTPVGVGLYGLFAVDTGADQVIYLLLATSQSLGWEIVHQDPEQLTINARESSFVFKFVDDIVIRVKADGAGAILDLRSKSRDGRGDLGVNAARIVEFLATFSR